MEHIKVICNNAVTFLKVIYTTLLVESPVGLIINISRGLLDGLATCWLYTGRSNDTGCYGGLALAVNQSAPIHHLGEG